MNDATLALNVFGRPLVPCGHKGLTGFYRDGCCNSRDEDLGLHTVCIIASSEFLQYTRFKGNDLSTPNPAMQFPGLTPGDTWCLCASRWLQAYEDGMAPKVYLRRSHIRSLDILPLDVLFSFAQKED